jgi:hypothetical protein
LVDRHAPEARFNILNNQNFFGGKVGLRFSSWDNLSGISSIYILDEYGNSYPVQSGEGSLVLDHVANGNRTYVLEAEDRSGNTMITMVTVEERSGGAAVWDGAFLINVLALSLIAGLLCVTAVIIGRRSKG